MNQMQTIDGQSLARPPLDGSQDKSLSPNTQGSEVDRPRGRGVDANTDPNRLVDQVTSVGEQWADADEAACLLEETKKTMLAQYTMEHQKGGTATDAKGKAMSMAQAETLALADSRFKTHVEGMVRARTKANKLKIRYESGRAKIELLRTLLANRRAEMQMNNLRT